MGREVSREFRKAVEKKRIQKFAKAKSLVAKEIAAAQDDLSEARDRLKHDKHKYATITAYYSMFHAARALIYNKGYREKSHYYLLVALEALFVEKGLIDEELVKDFRTAMMLREGADYHGEFSREGAEASITSADNFLGKVREILESLGVTH